MAHYLEHILFKGTSKFGTQDWEKEKPLLDSIEAMFEHYGTITDAAERKAYSDSDNSLMGALKAKGVKVTKPDPAPFVAASKAVYDEFVKSSTSKSVLKSIQGM